MGRSSHRKHAQREIACYLPKSYDPLSVPDIRKHLEVEPKSTRAHAERSMIRFLCVVFQQRG